MKTILTPCACGHSMLLHDIEEYAGDGSDLCCVESCDQVGCPGKKGKTEYGDQSDKSGMSFL